MQYNSYGFKIKFDNIKSKEDDYLYAKAMFERCIRHMVQNSAKLNFVLQSPITINFLENESFFLTAKINNGKVDVRLYDGKNGLYDNINFNLLNKNFVNTLNTLTLRFDSYRKLQQKNIPVPMNNALLRAWANEKQHAKILQDDFSR